MGWYDTDFEGHDFDALRDEARALAEVYRLVSKDMSIFVGVTEMGRYDFELWLDRDGEQTEYFNSFDELDEFMREVYADADWEQ